MPRNSTSRRIEISLFIFITILVQYNAFAELYRIFFLLLLFPLLL